MPDLWPIANHLWQSTDCVVLAWILTAALKKNRARVRYWVWLAASMKFLLPFSLLASAGGELLSRVRTDSPTPEYAFVLERIGQPFGPAVVVPAPASAKPALDLFPATLLAIWLCGCAITAGSVVRKWWRIRVAQVAATPLPINFSIPVLSTPSRLEPGVFGLFRQVLLLPAGIVDYLPPAQLDAVLAHELCHARRRDNLWAAIHLVVETVFWFHPAVWWVRTRLVHERERACDEEVLSSTSDPRIYAEAILNICRFYMAVPALCISGVSGSKLKERIEFILDNPISLRLSTGRKLMLGIAGIGTLAGPILIGMATAPPSRRQSAVGTQAESFEVASIKVSRLWRSGGEGSKRSSIEYSPNSLTMRNVDLSECLEWAYGVKSYQISGPPFLTAERYDILAKPEGPSPVGHLRSMLQDLLAHRFALTLHRDAKNLPVYAMIVAKRGPRLPPPTTDAELSHRHVVESLPRVQGGDFVFRETSMPEFAEKLSILRGVDRPVVDRTGIPGYFDITLHSGASATLDPEGPSIFALLEEQLGLKLSAVKGSVEVLVIDHVEKPSGN
jgi:uncharacterized protein (TIGR03435 family)